MRPEFSKEYVANTVEQIPVVGRRLSDCLERIWDLYPTVILDPDKMIKFGIYPATRPMELYFRDVEFNPTPGQIRLWEFSYRMIVRFQKKRMIGLGRSFIQHPQNQFYLAEIVDLTLEDLKKQGKPLSDYTSLLGYSFYVYDNVENASQDRLRDIFDLHKLFAVTVTGNLANLTKTAMFLYSQRQQGVNPVDSTSEEVNFTELTVAKPQVLPISVDLSQMEKKGRIKRLN